MKDNTLPPLAFGALQGVVRTNPSDFADDLLHLWPHLHSCDVQKGRLGFMSQAALIKLPGTSLLTSSVTSINVSVKDNLRAAITLPISGVSRAEVGGKVFECGLDSGGLYVPSGAGPQKAEGIASSVLLLQIEPSKLEAAARAVSGLPVDRPIDLKTDHPRALHATSGGISLGSFAKWIGATIDLHQGSALVLNRLGFQEFLYRQLVLILRPDLQMSAQSEPLISEAAHDTIELVCDTIKADLYARHTLTDLALLAQMSVRGLQYAFQRRFGVSPMQWLQSQRLEAARQSILRNPHANIGQIAQDCGFASASSFSTFYKRRFGELPSKTSSRAD